MQPSPKAIAARAVHLLMFEALRREDRVLNKLSFEALVGIGPIALPMIVREAATSTATSYRLRLLRIVEEIGEAPDPEDHLAIFQMTTDPDSRIRAAAVRAIKAIRRHRQVIPVTPVPTTVEKPMKSLPEPTTCEGLSPDQPANAPRTTSDVV